MRCVSGRFRMNCSLQSSWLWRACLLFCLELFLHCGAARIKTVVQAGPLYRVVGSPLSISCNVSGFYNPGRQEFEFRVAKPQRPNHEINIISTADNAFGYSVYVGRVRRDEITLSHVAPTSVLFEIKTLEKSDEGEYDCAVVNSEAVYDGIYSVKTTVKVIDNSLTVSNSGPPSLSYNEGDALTLTCQASSNTIQHTHLSLAWYLRKDGEDNAQPIISLDRDFKLIPGQGFEGRYRAGLIRLDKLEEATYKLNIVQLEPSDQGSIYCQAQEWIQDPDRSWYSIVQSKAEETILNVKAKEVVQDTSSLVVRLSAQPASLHEGKELSLSCSINTQNVQGRFFSVAWLRGSVELARVGPTGILSVGSEYSVREREGELRASRVGPTDYRLILQPVRSEDHGEYICRAWPQDRGQDGAFTQGAAQDSNSEQVTVSAADSSFSLEMQSDVSVNEGGKLQLTCKMQGAKGQFSVAWQRKASASTAAYSLLVALSQEGVMERAEESAGRQVTASRPTADTFVLELDDVTPSDAGSYQCVVSEWKVNSKTITQSQTANVIVAPAESFVTVGLKSRNTVATVGENVELICQVKRQNLAVTLTWSVQRDDSSLVNILTLYNDGDISWSGDWRRYQVKVLNKPNETFYYLLINGVSHKEAGRYQCSAAVFLNKQHKRLPSSNQLAVNVKNPESKMQLSSTPNSVAFVNTDVQLACSVVSEPSPDSRYAVTWRLQRQADTNFLVKSDLDALVTFGPLMMQKDRERISVKRSKAIGLSFELKIHQAQMSDNGSYICDVEEWLKDPLGDWYKLPPVSKTIQLSVSEPVSGLKLDKKEESVNIREGERVDFKCNIISDVSSPSFFYKVTWLYSKHGGAFEDTLVELDHKGLLNYPESQKLGGLQKRLRISRPSPSSFYLGIQGVYEEDSGTYMCEVGQYQLDKEDQWEQKALERAGPITLTVNVTENNLSVQKKDLEVNVTTSQDFTIQCLILQNSSVDSEFQVTWFSQRSRETEQRPIFTAYRNSTLQDRFGKGDRVRFSHPSPNQFSLRVLNVDHEDSGLYFCEVEEWLQSPSHGWRRIAVEKSGDLAVNVYAEDGKAEAESGCKPGTWIGILVAVVIGFSVIICLLMMKIFLNKGGKKQEKSLWAEKREEVPLSAKPNLD